MLVFAGGACLADNGTFSVSISLEILLARFENDLFTSLVCFSCREALEKAEVLLKINKSIVKLDNVWGVGGGNRPVKFLTSKVQLHF